MTRESLSFPSDPILVYATEEAGEWVRMPEATSKLPPSYALIGLRGLSRTVTINGVRLHSFVTKAGHRWDCYSGWTGVIEGLILPPECQHLRFEVRGNELIGCGTCRDCQKSLPLSDLFTALSAAMYEALAKAGSK